MIVSLDIETKCTQGCTKKCKHAFIPKTCEITCVGVYSEKEKRVFRDLTELEAYLKLIPDLKLIGHNFKFDLKHLHYNGVDLREHWFGDTLLMASVDFNKVPLDYIAWYDAQRIINNKKLPQGFSHREAKGHSLKVLAPYLLNVPPFWENPVDHDNDEYVLKDCQYTYDLYTLFKERLEAQNSWSFYSERLLPWSKMLLDSEIRGVKIDLPQLLKEEVETQKKVAGFKVVLDSAWKEIYEAEYDKKVAELTWEWNDKISEIVNQSEEVLDKYIKWFYNAKEKIPLTMNLNSPKQLLTIFNDYLNLKVKSTNAKTLKVLSRDREDVRILYEYRKAKKLTTSFFAPYKELHEEGVLHCNFNPTGTRTGRLSSSGPNLQQVPGALHKLFIARPGYKLATFDMAQIEARLIAFYSEDPILVDIVQSGKDFHGFQAKIYFPEIDCDVNEVKEKYPKERDFSKTLGYALFYGAAFKRVQDTAILAGYKWPDSKCKEVVDNFKVTYSQVVDYKDRIDKEARSYPLVNLFGRRFYFPDPEDIYMKNFNTLIQGSASDMVLAAGLEVSTRPGYQVLMFVHDELVVEVKDSISDADAESWITGCMTNFKLSTPLGTIPLTAEGKIGQRWEK